MTNIIEMLEQSAIKHPNKIAFSDPEKKVNFSDLNNISQKIASVFLDEALGFSINMESAIAFYMEKSVDAVKAMFGAVAVGAFYSFIDIRQPATRAQQLIQILEPELIITDDKNYDALVAYELDKISSCKIINISELLKIAASATINIDILSKRKSMFYDKMPLYVNFTSGSTGVPKGVIVGHASVIDFIKIFTETFEISDSDILANQAPFDFDVSVKDIYSGLYKGAQVALIPREYFSDPTTLMDYLYDNKVTILIWAVSAMCFVSIMNGLEYKTPVTVRKIMFSGELMPVKQLNKWRTYLPNATYVNLYGPTEITCNCTYHILDREYDKADVLPIGIPFKNERVILLDDNDQLVTEADTEGEICVIGSCLALGYFKDPDKTNAAFVQNPINNRFSELMYRTGDMGKYDEEGLLYYTSRKDFQIKHMGQRIELGDIEVCAMSMENVSRACCIYDFKKKKIILFYTGTADKQDLSNALHEKLPLFMIPSKSIQLEEMPLNKNGKIDRKALEELK